jgi:hypothetical protein
MIAKYDLSYVYLSESQREIRESGQSVWPLPWKDDFTQDERIMIYLENPYLEIAYRSGNAIVFGAKAIPDEQE